MGLTVLRLRNFQGHAWKEIPLDPHITVLAGPSDAGKSAVLRALTWLALNTPAGDDFLRWGARGVRVEIEVDGHLVGRKRGGRDNVYTLDGATYAAVGAGKVPDDIARLLRLTPLNFQGQLDPPFWFTLTAGEVSRQLNSIVRLDLIDSTLTTLASDLRRQRAALELCQERQAQAQARADALGWVDTASEALDALEAIQTRKNGVCARSQSLADCRDRLLALAERQRPTERALHSGQEALNLAGQLSRACAARDSLRRLLEQHATATELASTCVPHDALALLEELSGRLLQLRQRQQSLEKLLDRLDTAQETLCATTQALNDQNQALSTAAGAACPLCGSPSPPAPMKGKARRTPSSPC